MYTVSEFPANATTHAGRESVVVGKATADAVTACCPVMIADADNVAVLELNSGLAALIAAPEI